MSKITDFKLAATYIKQICRRFKVPFFDFDVVFEEPQGIRGNSISIGETSNVSHTIYRIVSNYIANSDKFTKKKLFANNLQKDDFLLYLSTTLRHLVYSGTYELDLNEFNIKRLYQNRLVWLIIKDIVCPINKIAPSNILILVGNSPNVDIAKFYEQNQVDSDKLPAEPLIFVNYDIGNEPVRDAFMCIEAIRGHELDPREAISDILAGEMATHFMGLVDLAYDDNSAEEFFAMLFIILDLDIDDFSHIKESYSTALLGKTSQMWDSPGVVIPMMWWYLGITEKMLEPVRGYDWSTHKVLEGYIKDFWDRIEKMKSKKDQGDGVPFNSLLRIKSKQTADPEIDHTITLQSLLSSQRIYN